MAEPNANENTNNNLEGNGNTTPPATPPVSNLNFEDLIKKARQDEKNKLYPEIEKLKTELEQKTQRINELLIKVAEQDEGLTAAEKKFVDLQKQVETLGQEGEKIVAKDKELDDLKKQVETLTSQLAESNGNIEKVKAEYELKDYRKDKMKDLDESVYDLVTGNTKEEIDASVDKAKAVYDKIAAKVAPAGNQSPPANNNAPAANQMPPANMSVINDAFGKLNPEDLWNLDPASPEYAEMRKKLGLK